MSLTNAGLPDFDAIADKVAATLDDSWGHPIALDVLAFHKKAVMAALLQVWNARGAADAKIVDAVLTSSMGVTAAGPYVKNIERALQQLDQA